MADQMSDWCRFDIKKEAEDALLKINSNKRYPFTVVDEKTKVSATADKQQTLRWDYLHEFTDGKWGFRKPDSELMTALELDDKTFDKATIESFNPSWIAAEIT